MELKIKENARYAEACVTSMGVRITPDDRMSVFNSQHFYMQATSAETNVLNVTSSLGERTLAMTRFVKDSPIALFIQRELRKRGIDYIGPEVDAGGPWGYRHQFNIADAGFGLRAPRVYNDRAGEVGRTLDASDYDTEKIFGEEGVGILHMSGLVAALSEQATDCCVKLAREAKKYGTLISFDLNYRDSFWEGREKELREAFTEIAFLSDILLGNESHYRLCLGLEMAEEKNLSGEEKFKKLAETAAKVYPNTKVFAATLREDVSANMNRLGAVIYADGKLYAEPMREVDVMDRIGGGDGFAGGLLYGIIKGYPPEKWLQLGWGALALAEGSINDYAEPADEKQLLDMYRGNARVQR